MSTLNNQAPAAQVTSAQASVAMPVPPKPNMFLQAIPLVVIVIFFYFFIIRPQRKKMKEVGEMLSKVKIGSKVLTAAGIYATVVEIDESAGLAKIEASKNVRLTITKSSIVSILDNGDASTEAAFANKS